MRSDMARMEQMMGPADITASHVMSVDPSTIMSSEMMTPASSDDTAMRDHPSEEGLVQVVTSLAYEHRSHICHTHLHRIV